MKYLLDTNAIIAMFRDLLCMREAFLKVGFNNCFVSEITLAELFVGIYIKPIMLLIFMRLDLSKNTSQ